MHAQKEFAYSELENFDPEAGAQELDSCMQGGCILRGHLFESILPLLKSSKTNTLGKDEQTKLFNKIGRENFVRPLAQEKYSSVPAEALMYNNYRLNIDNLQQARLNRRENVQFRNEIRGQSLFDACVGVIFLCMLAYKFCMAIWTYVNNHWFKRKIEAKNQKKIAEASEIYSQLCAIAEERRQNKELDKK